MFMKIKCDKLECPLNEKGKCISPEDRDCERDIFKCKRCGYQEMMEDPLEMEKCPNCGTKKWDLGEVTCGGCGYKWYPQSSETKRCPNCGRELKKL